MESAEQSELSLNSFLLLSEYMLLPESVSVNTNVLEFLFGDDSGFGVHYNGGGGHGDEKSNCDEL